MDVAVCSVAASAGILYRVAEAHKFGPDHFTGAKEYVGRDFTHKSRINSGFFEIGGQKAVFCKIPSGGGSYSGPAQHRAVRTSGH